MKAMTNQILTYITNKIRKQECQYQKRPHFLPQRGQILIEYILLVIIVLALAKVLMDELVQRGADKDAGGFVIQQWVELSDAIAEDPADEAP